MRQFLADRRAEVDPKKLAAAVKAAKEQLKREKRDPDKLLPSSTLLDALLRRELSLPMAWQIHLGRVLTQQAIRDEYDRHRSELDGTEVRASQIFLRLPETADAVQVKSAEEKLAKLRSEIVAGEIKFADAARRYSEAPSAADGGDVGWFAFRGKMPPEICRVVFRLKPGEIGAPFRTKFGVHLYTVTQIRPGNLNLEDVRTSVIHTPLAKLVGAVRRSEREKAKIDWKAAHLGREFAAQWAAAPASAGATAADGALGAACASAAGLKIITIAAPTAANPIPVKNLQSGAVFGWGEDSRASQRC